MMNTVEVSDPELCLYTERSVPHLSPAFHRFYSNSMKDPGWPASATTTSSAAFECNSHSSSGRQSHSFATCIGSEGLLFVIQHCC